MIVLTTGPASLARLMRRDGGSRRIASREVDGQGDRTDADAQPQRRVQPPRF